MRRFREIQDDINCHYVYNTFKSSVRFQKIIKFKQFIIEDGTVFEVSMIAMLRFYQN